jgi:hypothetical protein
VQLIGATIFYDDDPRLLHAALASLAPWCDRIVCVDGAYADYPGATARSCDAVRAEVKAIGAELIDNPDGTPWVDQAAKRSAYLRGSEGDWYVVLDADEVLTGGEALRYWIERFGKLYEWVHVALHEPGSATEARREPINVGYRVFRHLTGCRYVGEHTRLRDALGRGYAFASGEEEPNQYRTGGLIHGVAIEHYRERRSAERLARQAAYYRTRAHK